MPEFKNDRWYKSSMQDERGDQKSFCTEPMLHNYEVKTIAPLMDTFDVLHFNVYGEPKLMAAIDLPLGTFIASYLPDTDHLAIWPNGSDDKMIFSDHIHLGDASRAELVELVLNKIKEVIE